jgi:cell wall assembly regulator SMI1
MASFFQSISALFGYKQEGPSNTNLRRTQALSSTHDAFSLPMHSPQLAPVPDSQATDYPNTPYTYPPTRPTSTTYEDTPFASSDALNRSRTGSILPLHRSSLAPLPSYPPLAHTWTRFRDWLYNEYPELGDTLNWGVTPALLAQVELQLGMPLPPAVRDSYLVTDGQEAESSAGCSEGLFFGLKFLPLEDVYDEWRLWREVDDDPDVGGNATIRDRQYSIPNDWIRREYSCRGWLPLATDRSGNYLGVDLNPGPGGVAGQVIVFGRDFDTKVVMWKGEGEAGWARWLANFVSDLESREGFELATGDSGSEGSEDGIGYESYFYEGSGGSKIASAGDTGNIGLRLSGEYKGWPVLEAWADRSVKQWRQAGLIPEVSTPQQRAESSSRVTSLTMGTTPGTEVPIPVLVEPSDSNLEPQTPRAASHPPAPAPISLPTQEDLIAITVTPPLSDIEEGLSPRESRDSSLEIHHPLPSLPRVPSPLHETTLISTEAPLPPLPAPTPPSKSPEPTQSAIPEARPSLLDGSPPQEELIPVADTPPFNETDATPTVESLNPHPLDLLPNGSIPDGDASEDSLDPPVGSTIRLIGSGGISGNAADADKEEAVLDEEPAETDVAGDKKAKKKFGLKKIGDMAGGKRKKDSIPV